MSAYTLPSIDATCGITFAYTLSSLDATRGVTLGWLLLVNMILFRLCIDRERSVVVV